MFDPKELKTGLEYAARAMGDRPVLRTVLFDRNAIPGRVALVACDGYRLHRALIPVGGLATGNFLLTEPHKLIKWIRTSTRSRVIIHDVTDESVTFAQTFKGEARLMAFKRFVGGPPFPDYQAIIPNHVSPADLTLTARDVRTLAAVFAPFKGCHITSKSPTELQATQIHEDYRTRGYAARLNFTRYIESGTPIDLGLYPGMLADALIDDREITLKTNGTAPILINQDHFTAVIMPCPKE